MKKACYISPRTMVIETETFALYAGSGNGGQTGINGEDMDADMSQDPFGVKEYNIENDIW